MEPFDPPKLARTLMAQEKTGALATLEPGGAPLGTLVTYALDEAGQPIFLFSQLSAHAKNLLSDPRASLLIAHSGKGDPLSHPRVTLIGKVEPSKDTALRSLFLKRHPKTKLYIDFPDFSFWVMMLEGAHLNGGFARAARLSAAELAINDKAS